VALKNESSGSWSMEESEVPFDRALEEAKKRFRKKQIEAAGIIVPASDGWQAFVYGGADSPGKGKK
jgi:hypothetical protein